MEVAPRILRSLLDEWFILSEQGTVSYRKEAHSFLALYARNIQNSDYAEVGIAGVLLFFNQLSTCGSFQSTSLPTKQAS